MDVQIEKPMEADMLKIICSVIIAMIAWNQIMTTTQKTSIQQAIQSSRAVAADILENGGRLVRPTE